jgi:hypothetical protein
MQRNRLGALSDDAINELEAILLDAAKEGVSVRLSEDGRSVLAHGEPSKCWRLGETLKERRMFSLALAWVRARGAMTDLTTRLTNRKPT